jgi:hypothetical protein
MNNPDTNLLDEIENMINELHSSTGIYPPSKWKYSGFGKVGVRPGTDDLHRRRRKDRRKYRAAIHRQASKEID